MLVAIWIGLAVIAAVVARAVRRQRSRQVDLSPLAPALRALGGGSRPEPQAVTVLASCRVRVVPADGTRPAA